MFLSWQDYNLRRQYLFSTCQACVCVCTCAHAPLHTHAHTPASKDNTGTTRGEDCPQQNCHCALPLFLSEREAGAVSADVSRLHVYMAIKDLLCAGCYKNSPTVSLADLCFTHWKTVAK